MDLGQVSGSEYVGVLTTQYDGITFYFIDNQRYFGGNTPYGDTRFDIEKFCFFSKAALSILPSINFKPDIIHCHDWQTGVLPVYLHTIFRDNHFYDNIKYKNCPHCENGLKQIRKETYCDDLDNLQTQFFADPFVKLPYTEGVDKECDITVNLDVSDVSKDSITVGLYNFNNGTQLLVGWLVEVKGVTKGKDYKLFKGWNRIGRSQLMDIYIPNDKKIFANNHLSLIHISEPTRH